MILQNRFDPVYCHIWVNRNLPRDWATKFVDVVGAKLALPASFLIMAFGSPIVSNKISDMFKLSLTLFTASSFPSVRVDPRLPD